MTDPRLVKDVEGSEGCKLTAYLDTRGNWTIGYGHLLPKAAPGRSWEGFTISQAVADRYLQEDLAIAQTGAARLPEYASCDTDCRQNALTELVYNMGLGTWQTFAPTRALITAKQWQGVHDHLLASAWAKEVQPHGLDHSGRATRIADYFLSGQYPS